MKKIVCLFITVILLTACGTRRSLDIDRLRTGMTKAQVEYIAGSPDRLLAVRETDEGYQEVLGYLTSGGEMYALEFWNDYLTGYEYLYDEVQYYPSPYPALFPPYGRPIYIYARDPRPPYYRPNYNNRFNYNNPNNNYNRPGTTNPPANTNRPGTTTRPPGNSNTSPDTRPSVTPDTNRTPDRSTVTPDNSNSGTNFNTCTGSNRSNRSQ
ncbi:MAG: outer membrane protein assembly factor BamE [Tannerellaceae bacterium]|nr:outer membrane protein assembly factor BamE [Tannerellaceae bacterium]